MGDPYIASLWTFLLIRRIRVIYSVFQTNKRKREKRGVVNISLLAEGHNVGGRRGKTCGRAFCFRCNMQSVALGDSIQPSANSHLASAVGYCIQYDGCVPSY